MLPLANRTSNSITISTAYIASKRLYMKGRLSLEPILRMLWEPGMWEEVPFHNKGRWGLHWWIHQAVCWLWCFPSCVWLKGISLVCMVYALMLSFCRCKSCNHVMTAEEIEDRMYNQLDATNHLLHGVVHANGFGHLLRINGRQGGSRVLSGTHIMDFWDRICKVIGVRQVSVMDVSKKYGLEFRLLHSVVKGNPWYGDWGYEFGAGT